MEIAEVRRRLARPIHDRPSSERSLAPFLDILRG